MFRHLTVISASLIVAVHLLRPASVDSQESTVDEKTEKQRMTELGARFIKALQENSIERYHQCWVQIADVEAAIRMQVPGFSKVSEEQMRFVRDYFRNRNQTINLSFPILRRALNELGGGLNSISVAEVSGKVRVENESKSVSMFRVHMVAKNGVRIEYDIDDGTCYRDRWYFSDKPSWELTVFESGKSRIIGLGSFATDEEMEMIKRLEASQPESRHD